MHTYIQTCMHTYIDRSTYIHTYIRTYLPTYLHTYMHTYIYTLIHTQKNGYRTHTYALMFILCINKHLQCVWFYCISDGWRENMQSSEGREKQKRQELSPFKWWQGDNESSRCWHVPFDSLMLSDMLTTMDTDFDMGTWDVFVWLFFSKL